MTHGHIDHIGGAHALWELTGRRAQVVIHEADAHLLRSRQAHVDEYLSVRGQYLHDPDGEAKQIAATQAVISGEMEPTMLVRGGETLSLGGGVTVSVHSIPGHTPDRWPTSWTVGTPCSSVTPSRSTERPMDSPATRIRMPTGRAWSTCGTRSARTTCTSGIPTGGRTGSPTASNSTGTRPPKRSTKASTSKATSAAQPSVPVRGLREIDSPYSPFTPVAEDLGYDGDPTLEPSPFFTTLHGYRTQYTQKV